MLTSCCMPLVYGILSGKVSRRKPSRDVNIRRGGNKGVQLFSYWYIKFI